MSDLRDRLIHTLGGVPAKDVPERVPEDAWRERAFYLVAEPGWPNYGDELIAREWLQYLAQRYPDVPVVLDCNRPGQAAAILRYAHPHLTVVDTVARLTFENNAAQGRVVSGDATIPIAEYVRNTLTWHGGDPRYAMGVRLAEFGIRSVHYLGGGYMNGSWANNLARLEFGRLAAERGIPVFATGLGLMPLSEPLRSWVCDTTQDFSFIGVRDEETLSVFGDCEAARLMPDDCFINGLSGCTMERHDLPRFMVCMQAEFGTAGEGSCQLQRVIDALAAWGVEPHGECVGVAECNPTTDRDIYDRLVAQGYEVEFFPMLHILEQGLPVSRGQKWISSRYHPHLVAAAFGCEGSFTTVDSNYYDIKHRAVLRMGSRWTQLSLDGEDVPQPGPGFENPSTALSYAHELQDVANNFYDAIAHAR